MEFPNCFLYEGGKIPPCSEMLGNMNPIIKDNKLIFRNLNRLFYFLSLQTSRKKQSLNLNIQISLYNYLIGLFLLELEDNIEKIKGEPKLHDDDMINALIYEMLKNPPQIKDNFEANLVLVYSNNNAIMNPLTYELVISPLTFLILLIINRLENHPGLFFINNSYVTEDLVNFMLSELHIECDL